MNAASASALVATLLGACSHAPVSDGGGGEGGDGTSTSTGGTGGDGGVALCAATHFGAATEHALPQGYPAEAFDALGSAGDCDSGAAQPSYGLVDLDGDGLVDLIVTDDCLQDAVGAERWLLYPNDGAAFAAAEVWSLPDYGPAAFEHLTGAGACGSGDLKPSYGLVDLDGDDVVELVVADDCADDAIGRTSWRVHRNTGAGFSTEAEIWHLPDYGPEAFEHLTGDGACGNGALKPAYALLDLNRDEQLDLVVTDDCYTGAVGRSRWLVHENTGTGFDSAATTWELPDYGPEAFDRVSGAGLCGELKPAYGLADLDGDEAVDLVVTDDCVHEEVGRTRWRWHANTGAGFASGVDWALPDYGPSAFDHLWGGGSCDELKPAHGLVDLTGDGQLELVVTDDCIDAEVGRARWHLHRRDGEGFASSADAFGVPDYGPEPFEHLAGAGPCDDGALKPTYGLVDLDGDGHLDLVVADDCIDPSVGHTRWVEHGAVCE